MTTHNKADRTGFGELQKSGNTVVNQEMTNTELIQAIRQARQDETTLTDAFLAGRVPEHDAVVSMEATNILVNEAISRGLMNSVFDAI